MDAYPVFQCNIAICSKKDGGLPPGENLRSVKMVSNQDDEKTGKDSQEKCRKVAGDNEQIKMAKKCLIEGLSLDLISKLTGLGNEAIEKL